MKKNVIPVVLASGALISGAALAAVYAYLKVKEKEEEPEDGINEIYGDEEDEDDDEVVDLEAESEGEAEADEEAEASEEAEAAEETESSDEAAASDEAETAEETESADEAETTEETEAADEFEAYKEFEAPEEGENLESFIAEHPEEKESLDAVKESFTADGVRTDIEVTGNTMFFDFIMTDVDDEETRAVLKPDLESFLDEQSGAYSEVVSAIEDETGIKGIKMIVIFMDADEEEIVSAHYDDEGKTL